MEEWEGPGQKGSSNKTATRDSNASMAKHTGKEETAESRRVCECWDHCGALGCCFCVGRCRKAGWAQQDRGSHARNGVESYQDGRAARSWRQSHGLGLSRHNQVQIPTSKRWDGRVDGQLWPWQDAHFSVLLVWTNWTIHDVRVDHTCVNRAGAGRDTLCSTQMLLAQPVMEKNSSGSRRFHPSSGKKKHRLTKSCHPGSVASFSFTGNSVCPWEWAIYKAELDFIIWSGAPGARLKSCKGRR